MKLTEREAFKAMFSFLDDYYFKNKDRENPLVDLLSNMQVLPFYKTPVDIDLWTEWKKAIDKSKKNEVDIYLVKNKKVIEDYRQEFGLPKDAPHKIF